MYHLLLISYCLIPLSHPSTRFGCLLIVLLVIGLLANLYILFIIRCLIVVWLLLMWLLPLLLDIFQPLLVPTMKHPLIHHDPMCGYMEEHLPLIHMPLTRLPPMSSNPHRQPKSPF